MQTTSGQDLGRTWGLLAHPLLSACQVILDLCNAGGQHDIMYTGCLALVPISELLRLWVF